ncbi:MULTISPECIES: hypothetical protein [Mycobacterium]|uniref:hypothetical protein n=1 Tax=Mycobacterium TaxID=1763 RepID=UPI001EEFAA97|nr:MULTISPECIES: hypothetical protein [Mycobacterium]
MSILASTSLTDWLAPGSPAIDQAIRGASPGHDFHARCTRSSRASEADSENTTGTAGDSGNRAGHQ